MLPFPRPSTRSGLTTRGTLLLALAGAGAVVFLVFVFPRLSSSRAAERGPHRSEAVDTAATAAPADDGLVLDPSEILPPAPTEEQPSAPAPAPQAASTTTLLATSSTPEAPQLKRLNTGPKRDKVDTGAMRAQQRKDRKEREKTAAETGQPLPEHQAKSTTNPNASRLQRDKGRPGSRDGKKGKKDKPKDEPKEAPKDG